MRTISSYYPVVGSKNGNLLANYLINEFEFQAVFSADWYWHLTMKDQPTINLAIVDSQHQSVPEAFRHPVQGLILNIELDDVTAYYLACSNKQWDIVLPLRDEDWGQRHFIVATPEPGLLIDIIQVIPASAAFTELYTNEHLPA